MFQKSIDEQRVEVSELQSKKIFLASDSLRLYSGKINSAKINNCDSRKRIFNLEWFSERGWLTLSKGCEEPQIMDLFHHVRPFFRFTGK